MLHTITPDTWNALTTHFTPTLSVPEKRSENLRQLYQALLIATMDNNGDIDAYAQPDWLVSTAKEAWLADVSAVSVSALQREVGAALTSLGYPHRLEHMVADGLFSVDFALPALRVAVEVDGPHHFAVNTRRPLATTTTRHELLRWYGWTVVQVAYYDWQPLRGDVGAQGRLLQGLLTAAGVGTAEEVRGVLVQDADADTIKPGGGAGGGGEVGLVGTVCEQHGAQVEGVHDGGVVDGGGDDAPQQDAAQQGEDNGDGVTPAVAATVPPPAATLETPAPPAGVIPREEWVEDTETEPLCIQLE